MLVINRRFTDRAQGAFLGLALGDAYGQPLEFVRGDAVRTHAVPITKGQFRWTDDTHMALYLADAVLQLTPGPLDPEAFGKAVGEQFVAWSHDPHTPTTAPGGTCLKGAARYEQGRDWHTSGIAESDGCGAVMRIVALPITFSGDELAQAAEISARVTHAHPNAIEAAIAGCHLARQAMEHGALREDMVRDAITQLEGPWSRGGMVAQALKAAIDMSKRAAIDGWLDEAAVPPGDGGWRSASALGLAVAAVLAWGRDFEMAVGKAARIQGDSDSVACLVGMFLGAAGGTAVLPRSWLHVLPREEDIAGRSQALCQWTVNRMRARDQEPLAPPTLAPTSAPSHVEPASTWSPQPGVPGAQMGARQMGRPARTSLTDPIRVDWLDAPLPGRIGLTIAPGKRASSSIGPDWARDLATDLDRLKATFNTDLLVPLLDDAELGQLGIPYLVAEAETRGMVVIRLPIPDGGTPSLNEASRLVENILAFARSGRNVVIHCRGGLGRAGLIAACCLTRLGFGAGAAISEVRRCRAGDAIENVVQETFVQAFGQR